MNVMAPPSFDPLTRLEGLIPALPQALERQRLGEELARVEQLLASHQGDLRRFALLVNALGALHDVAHAAARGIVSDALAEAAEFGERLAKASTQADLRGLAPGFEGFRRSVNKLENTARLLWSELVRRDLEPLKVIGSILQGIDSAAALGAQLIEITDLAGRLGDRQQSALESFAAGLAPFRAEASVLRAEVAALTTDPEVDAFLRALAGGRADLRLATPSVTRWLEEMGALDRFVVRPRQ